MLIWWRRTRSATAIVVDRSRRLSLHSKTSTKRTRLSCRRFHHNAVRLQLHALVYNLNNFMRTLALPKKVEHWSLTTIREKLVKACPRAGGDRRQGRCSWVATSRFR
jgi:hypothetical protein